MSTLAHRILAPQATSKKKVWNINVSRLGLPLQVILLKGLTRTETFSIKDVGSYEKIRTEIIVDASYEELRVYNKRDESGMSGVTNMSSVVPIALYTKMDITLVLGDLVFFQFYDGEVASEELFLEVTDILKKTDGYFHVNKYLAHPYYDTVYDSQDVRDILLGAEDVAVKGRTYKERWS